MGSDAKDDLPVETATPFAKWLIMYFERLNASTPKNTWELGAQTAREWVRLIEGAPSMSRTHSCAVCAPSSQGVFGVWGQLEWGGASVPELSSFADWCFTVVLWSAY